MLFLLLLAWLLMDELFCYVLFGLCFLLPTVVGGASVLVSV